MPRSGWRKPVSDRRLSDLVSIGVLARVFPPDAVDGAVASAGREEERHRALPARVMTYFAVAMALYSEGSYEDVLGLLVDGLSWASGSREDERLPGKSAVFYARERLGFEPVRALFEQTARPLGAPGAQGVWLAGRRMVAIDGTCLDLADTPANEEFFGRPGSARGERAAFPQARVLALAECGTHAVLAAEAAPLSESENALAGPLIDRALGVGDVLFADRGFFSSALWVRARATGAALVWRVKAGEGGPKPVPVRELADGSWIGRLRLPGTDRPGPVEVRVVDYEVDDGRDNQSRYRLLTTLLDPAEAPAWELARAYTERWEIEMVFDELKTHQRGAREVLRSKSPGLVLQEIWGHLCCHYAIRSLMA
ncbi:MAG: IS4 family transposase, partial [Bifidobacteriaceae bacterium]|nr:IS4 family transposase [Bifidobacteriaceae bacterium]